MVKRKNKTTDDSISPKEMLLERAVAGFLSKLPEKGFPNESQLREGQNTAETIFTEMLCSKAFLPPDANTENRLGFIKLEFSAWLSKNPLQLPAPTFNERLDGIKLALAVILGTFLGGLLLSGLFNFISDNPETGMTIGTMIGAGGTVLLMWYASENKKLRRYLQGILGVATAAEVAILFGKLSGIGAIWSALRVSLPGMGLLRLLRRFFVYISVVFILRFSVRKPQFDRLSYQKNLRTFFDLWLDHAITFMETLHDKKLPEQISGNRKKIPIPKELGSSLLKIHQSSAEYLPDAAAEAILIARNIGIEGLDEEPAFINGQAAQPEQFAWDASFEEKYRTYGIIDDGDTVFIETRPVIQDGKVIEKGSVRKVRKR